MDKIGTGSDYYTPNTIVGEYLTINPPQDFNFLWLPMPWFILESNREW